MKKFSLVCVALSLGMLVAPAQADDPVAPQPEAAVVHEGHVHGEHVHEGYVEGGYYGGGGYTGIAGGHLVYPRRADVVRNAVHDRYHPHPFYAHGRRGLDATWTHEWNQSMAAGLPWHGGYYYPQYGQPVALIVPPTASFISNYGWGVGNTTSMPIYHQFARPYPGPASGGNAAQFAPPPYWPSNTNQFGVYPVRGPW